MNGILERRQRPIWRGGLRRIVAVKRTLNLAAYKFVDLDHLPALRARIRAEATVHGLLGTVLLAPEGINLVLAGAPPALREFMAWLRGDARLAGLSGKESWSASPPFGSLVVKIKREIIRIDQPVLRPATGRAPTVDAATLARWLGAGHDDDGRAVMTLDTRNAFEVELGGFVGALDWRLARFGDFPAALATHRDALHDKTVVTYCTGGIRCEKAALLMQAAGIENVRQLDRGILGYFEQTQGAPHWQGRCFVFDGRHSLDPALQPAVEPVG